MNLLLFYPDEIKPDGAVTLTGTRAVSIIKQHELAESGISVKAGVRGGKLGTALLTIFDTSIVGNERVEFRLELTEDPPHRSPVEIIIGIPRPQTVKKIIQVATSFGIEAIHFVPFEKTIKSYQSSKIWLKENIEIEIMESLQQVCDTCAPQLIRYQTLNEFYNHYGNLLPSLWEHCVVFDARGKSDLDPSSTFRYLFFGPEAGFSERELSFFRTQGASFTSLGKRMLRLEHAVCAGLQKFSKVS